MFKTLTPFVHDPTNHARPLSNSTESLRNRHLAMEFIELKRKNERRKHGATKYYRRFIPPTKRYLALDNAEKHRTPIRFTLLTFRFISCSFNCCGFVATVPLNFSPIHSMHVFYIQSVP